MTIKKNILRPALILAFILFANKSLGEVRIQTLDSWNIESYSPDALMVRKSSEHKNNYLAFEMNRPFCICSEVSFVMYEDNDFKSKQKMRFSDFLLFRPSKIAKFI